MVRLLPVLLLLVLSSSHAGRLPPVPTFKPAPPPPGVAGFRVCVQGGVRYQLDERGRVRFLEHGHRFPDNTLSVTQSYDRAGRLSGITVRQTGFAGRVLDVRGTFDARGRLVKETGFRAPGMGTPLRAYLRAVPGNLRC